MPVTIVMTHLGKFIDQTIKKQIRPIMLFILLIEAVILFSMHHHTQIKDSVLK